MLKYLRNNADSFLIKMLLALISVVFIFFFGSSAMMSDQTAVVAKVNGEVIRDVELDRRTRSALRSQQRYQPNMTPADRARLQQRVLDGMIEEKLLIQAAKDQGFLVSDAELRQAIMDDPSFQNDQGTFDKGSYDRYVERRGSASLEGDIRERLMIRSVQMFVSSTVQVAPSELRQAFIDESVSRAISFLRVPTSLFEDEVDLSDEERDGWAKEHGAEIQARYDRDFNRVYDQPKKVRAKHILMKWGSDEGEDAKALVRAKMEQVLIEAQAPGADFGALARKWSEDSSATRDGDLGLFDEKRMVKAFSDAAFSMAVGEVSELVETQYGLHIIKVEEIQEKKLQTLDQATAAIADELIKEERAPELARAYASSLKAVLDGSVSGEDGAKLLAERSLSIELSGDFNRKDGRIPKLGAAPEALAAAFALVEVGDVTAEPVKTPTGFVVMKLTAKTDADMSAFEAKKGEIQERLLRGRQRQAITAFKNDLRAAARIELATGV